MVCSNCKNPIQPGWRACPSCGMQFAEAVPGTPILPAGNVPPVLPAKKSNRGGCVVGCLGFIVIAAIIGAFSHSGSGGASSVSTPTEQGTPFPTPSNPQNTPDASPTSVQDTPQFIKTSENFSDSDGFCQVDGEVKNVSNDSIDSAEATTSFYDKSGNVVTTSQALLTLQPILPGQVSTYKVMQEDNPAIATEKTTFDVLGGGSISFIDKHHRR